MSTNGETYRIRIPNETREALRKLQEELGGASLSTVLILASKALVSANPVSSFVAMSAASPIKLPKKLEVSRDFFCKDNQAPDNGEVIATAVKRGRGRPKTKVRPVTFWASKPAWDYLKGEKKRTGKPLAAIIEEALAEAAKK